MSKCCSNPDELPKRQIPSCRCKVSECEFSKTVDKVFLIRTGTAPVAIHGNVRLSRTSCSLHPVFLHFSRKYHHLPTNILGRTFRPPWAFCILESLKKTVAPAGYKNKQCRKQTSVLSGRTVTAYVPLRSATERERAAFLIPCQGLRGRFLFPLQSIPPTPQQIRLCGRPVGRQYVTCLCRNRERHLE